MKKLKGSAAVISGASSGIGRAISLALAEEEAKLFLIGRNRDRLEETAATAKGADAVTTLAIDLRGENASGDVAQRVQQEFGKVDLLVHCAGIVEYGLLQESGVELLDRHLDINLRVPYRLTRALLPSLILNRGQIVFINSSIVDWPKGNAGQYATSKHALTGLADSLRQEVNEAGVRVLSIYPGRTATPRQKGLHKEEGRDYYPEKLLQPEDIAAIMLSALLLPGTAEVTDIRIRPMTKT